MHARRPRRATLRVTARLCGSLALLSLPIAACGGGGSAPSAAAHVATHLRGSAATGASAPSVGLRDWPEFGLDPQRGDATSAAGGVAVAELAHLRRRRIVLPGTVDSSPIYLHAVTVGGAARDAIVVTTTYGKTLALDASSGAVLWTFTPPGYARWAGTAQITTASPAADPDRRFVYAASPNGLIHKLALADGREAGGAWPVSVTRDATHEKLAAALNLDGPYVVATTGGYIGDIPPYQGHVVLIDRATGAIRAVFNTLCANRREVIAPASCPASDSAILARAGAVVEPGGRRILIDTGNAPWNGRTDFGDSVLELTVPALRLRQSFTPTDQAQLNSSDTDLGSSAPALLGQGRVVLAGKDGIMRVLDLARLDGRPPSPRHTVLGGELQRLPIPGGGQLFTAPAVWREGTRTRVFVAGFDGTGAYALRGGRLRLLWSNDNAGTSPILVGGLLYVYDPTAGGIYVYRPSSPRPLIKLPGAPGHWNSPIVLEGRVIEPEGDANDHRLTGTLDLFAAR